MGQVVDFFTAEEIFAVNDIKTLDVEVSEWGGKVVRMQTISAEVAAQYYEDISTPEGRKLGALRLVFCSAVKEDGSRLFNTLEDLEKLQKKSFRALLKLQKAALELNGIGPEAKKETGKD